MVKRRNNLLSLFTIFAGILAAVLVFWGAFKVREGVKERTGQASNSVWETDNKATEINILSPDGKVSLTLKNIKTNDGLIDQTLLISSDENNLTQIFTQNSTTGGLLTIPYNTFSPDNKYFFIRKNKADEPEYLVMRTDGKNLRGDTKSVEIYGLFKEKYKDFKITDITGWAGPTLTVINTDLKNGGAGPSFWFDLSNHSFIRLSTRFN